MRGNRMMFLVLVLTVGGFFLLPSLLFAGQAATPPMSGHSMPMQGQHMGTLDLNSASAEDLRMVPGINETTAKKIVENRPYKRKDELVTKKVVPLATYEAIKDHIAAGPAK